MSEENVMDAVNAALGSGDIKPPQKEDEPHVTDDADTATETESGSTESEGGDDPSVEGTERSDESGSDEGASEVDSGGEAAVGTITTASGERNPDGTFKKKADEPPKKDPINDPIPKDLKKETSERIRTLIDTAKTVTAERDQVQTDFNYLVKGIEATGSTPQQYGEALSWLALFNSRDPQQQEKALELVESVAERLATLLGKERTVGDPLTAHPDLKDAVTKGQITAQYAKEIARTRNGQTFRQELTQNATTEGQRQQQAQQEENQGRQALTDLETTLRASDADYEAKKAVLVPALKPLMSSLPWNQKAAKFLEAYKSIQLPRAAAVVRKGVPANQPMRSKQPAGGQSKAPSSMAEAIDGALASMK